MSMNHYSNHLDTWECLIVQTEQLIYKMPELGIKPSLVSSFSFDELVGLRNYLESLVAEKKAI